LEERRLGKDCPGRCVSFENERPDASRSLF
jgi:hypothetical protein